MNVQLVTGDRLAKVMARYNWCLARCERLFLGHVPKRITFADGSWVRHVPACQWGVTDRNEM